jgi:hypothetical protein
MSNISREQWKEFHYGKKFEKPKSAPKNYSLIYRNEILVQNKPYAYCLYMMNDYLKSGNFIKDKFKIVPYKV